MLDEEIGVMEKKLSTRQASGQCRNGGVTCERKSDFTPNRHGRGRRSSNGSAKTQDTPRPISTPKWDRSFGDSRQRQRICYDYRQREEVEEGADDVFDVLSTGSRKGNANHLLNFKFYPRQSQSDDHRWYDRSRFNNHGRGGYRKTTRYKKEQFLQASCQFVVRDTGDYTEQAINSDALVDWNMIELVRSYSTEPVNCPICLQIPTAGKITKCGHTYCWSCILHYLKLGQNEARKCPICYDNVEVDDLKSVQWIDVPDFNVGDEIKMRLMRKAKGSVISMPKDQWEDRKGKPMNIKGTNTKYMKLLVASCDQIQKDVIDIERVALTVELDDAEESEACFIEMALEHLRVREVFLEKVFQESTKIRDKISIPGLSSSEIDKAHEKLQEKRDAKPEPPATVYADAFDDEIVEDCTENIPDIAAESQIIEERETAATVLAQPRVVADDESTRQRNDSECSLPFGSPPVPFPLMPDQEVNSVSLSLEEKAERLELPMDLPQAEKQQPRKARSLNTRDTYYFYQASTGQHIYMNSLNAQCLSKEYESLEESPNNIKATIVAIERIFMTEDVRKRLRYLDHIPLTCEFHVVELKLKPPVVSKETLKSFEVAFEKKRKLRQQRDREDKRRAKRFEMEQRKSDGLYPEMQIPLDNMNQFPSYLSSSWEEDRGADSPPQVSESSLAACAPDYVEEEKFSYSRRSRNDSTSDESLSGSMSFAQMLKAGKTSSPYGGGGAWGKASPSYATSAGLSASAAPTRSRRGDEEDSDGGEALLAPSYSESMSDAIGKALDGINLRRQTADNGTALEPNSGEGRMNSGGGRKKKKEKQSRKERQVLFSTSMAGKS